MHPLLVAAFTQGGIDASTVTLRGNIAKATASLPESSSPSSSSSSSETYYAKTAHTATDIAHMCGEAASLRAMSLTAPPGLVPRVMHSVPVPPTGLPETIDSDHDPASASAGDMPTAMAGLEYTGKYGFAVPTHCGANEQDNRWEESWEVFFRDRRLGHIVHLLNDKRVGTAWEEMKERWVERDASDGVPVIYDPASYYGHAEADLGITHMFGGFSPAFYEAYHSVHPRSQPYYEQRQTLYELYHHLNHAVLFGGGSYTSSALRMMRQLVAWAEEQ
ncbi:uncharacterized protein EHS24_003463 [Apiotrichum porosum]|uniref:protein-ribulosamine 3-kinase n=1 Tax=Apiotrichum porosum TaxID=105984 RepID=A0A427XF86_9TREE|nr:uncharacterized protein EHS24_003463 [Apiotrichum porosum]RSH77486.1 hypothetical protein EHS24_003463 [Apiotrichum porosum]